MLEEEIEVQGKQIDVITWREDLPNNLVFVTLQFWSRHFLGSRCKTEGFIIETDDKVREVTDEEWDEYGGL